ncbi:MAG TPA: serine hydrolase [Alphaproteobacteria bacterium]|nr:serine hydrolase [Alphaproteobacteria bacterium]HNS44804.1 serine hydrolase [Alphaproteobacteria bacterium]
MSRSKRRSGFRENGADVSRIAAQVAYSPDGSFSLHPLDGHVKGISDPVPTASLAKMMTTYLVFDALRDGRLKPEQRISIPKEVYKFKDSGFSVLPKGTKDVTVEEALVGMTLQSNNYLTYALAKQVGGTEANFVEMMNNKAQALDLDRTKFYSATGLPVIKGGKRYDSMSTLEELSRLQVHLYNDFPEYKEILGRDEAFVNGMQLGIGRNNPVLHGLGGDVHKTGTLKCNGSRGKRYSDITSYDTNQDGKIDQVTGVMCAASPEGRNSVLKSLKEQLEMTKPTASLLPVSDRDVTRPELLPSPSSAL